MLTGYNTDVSYDGEIFHVQTEDKGIKTPIILSLVYRAGTILAAKRTSYENHIHDGVIDEAAVTQLLNKQHNILVAAVKSGKSEKLAAMSRQQNETKTEEVPTPSIEVPVPVATVPAPVPVAPETPPFIEAEIIPLPVEAPKPVPPLPTAEPIKVEPAHSEPQFGVAAVQTISLNQASESLPPTALRPTAPTRANSFDVSDMFANPNPEMVVPSFDQIISGYLQTSSSSDQLRIELLYPSKFAAGDEVTVRAAILYGGHSPASNAMVKLQILGTRIDPQNLTAKTDFQGLVSFNVKIPNFASGAAALVISAKESGGQETEMKYMIRKK